jgi:hypothetical protein
MPGVCFQVDRAVRARTMLMKRFVAPRLALGSGQL